MSAQNEQANAQVNAQNEDHSIMNGRFKSKPKDGKLFLEIADKLCDYFEGMPKDAIIQLFWGEPRENLDKLIKKDNKREKKVSATFAPEGLTKPSNANILFQRHFKAECDKKGVKFSLKDSAAAYKALSEKEKAKYVAEAAKLKEEYKKEFARLKAEAVKNGEFPEDKPKRPITAYLRYLNDVRAELMDKHKNTPNKKDINKLVAKESGEMWKALSDDEKAPYIEEFNKEKEAHDAVLKKWKDGEVARCKKQNGDGAVEVKIEAAVAPAAAPPAPAAAAAAADEGEVEAKVVKPIVKRGSKAAAK